MRDLHGSEGKDLFTLRYAKDLMSTLSQGRTRTRFLANQKFKGKAKSVYKPSGRDLSQLLWHEATRGISHLPPGWDVSYAGFPRPGEEHGLLFRTAAGNRA